MSVLAGFARGMARGLAERSRQQMQFRQQVDLIGLDFARKQKEEREKKERELEKYKDQTEFIQKQYKLSDAQKNTLFKSLQFGQISAENVDAYAKAYAKQNSEKAPNVVETQLTETSVSSADVKQDLQQRKNIITNTPSSSQKYSVNTFSLSTPTSAPGIPKPKSGPTINRKTSPVSFLEAPSINLKKPTSVSNEPFVEPEYDKDKYIAEFLQESALEELDDEAVKKQNEERLKISTEDLNTSILNNPKFNDLEKHVNLDFLDSSFIFGENIKTGERLRSDGSSIGTSAGELLVKAATDFSAEVNKDPRKFVDSSSTGAEQDKTLQILNRKKEIATNILRHYSLDQVPGEEALQSFALYKEPVEDLLSIPEIRAKYTSSLISAYNKQYIQQGFSPPVAKAKTMATFVLGPDVANTWDGTETHLKKLIRSNVATLPDGPVLTYTDPADPNAVDRLGQKFRRKSDAVYAGRRVPKEEYAFTVIKRALSNLEFDRGAELPDLFIRESAAQGKLGANNRQNLELKSGNVLLATISPNQLKEMRQDAQRIASERRTKSAVEAAQKPDETIPPERKVASLNTVSSSPEEQEENYIFSGSADTSSKDTVNTVTTEQENKQTTEVFDQQPVSTTKKESEYAPLPTLATEKETIDVSNYVGVTKAKLEQYLISYKALAKQNPGASQYSAHVSVLEELLKNPTITKSSDWRTADIIDLSINDKPQLGEVIFNLENDLRSDSLSKEDRNLALRKHSLVKRVAKDGILLSSTFNLEEYNNLPDIISRQQYMDSLQKINPENYSNNIHIHNRYIAKNITTVAEEFINSKDAENVNSTNITVAADIKTSLDSIDVSLMPESQRLKINKLKTQLDGYADKVSDSKKFNVEEHFQKHLNAVASAEQETENLIDYLDTTYPDKNGGEIFTNPERSSELSALAKTDSIIANHLSIISNKKELANTTLQNIQKFHELTPKNKVSAIDNALLTHQQLMNRKNRGESLTDEEELRLANTKALIEAHKRKKYIEAQAADAANNPTKAMMLVTKEGFARTVSVPRDTADKSQYAGNIEEYAGSVLYDVKNSEDLGQQYQSLMKADTAKRSRQSKQIEQYTKLETLGEEILGLVDENPDAVTAVAGGTAGLFNSIQSELNGIVTLLEDTGKAELIVNPDTGEQGIKITEGDVQLRARALLAESQSLSSINEAGAARKLLEAKLMLFVFRAGAIEGQSGTAMSNKDFERLLGAFRDNNPLIYKEKIKKYVIDSAKNINTQVDLYENTKNTGAFAPFNAVPPQILNALDKEFAFERVEVPEFATTSTSVSSVSPKSSGMETFITNRFNSFVSYF